MTTELYINGSLIDLEGSETIALTKSVFDLNQLGVRTSTYSNVFKAPKTNGNRLAFKSAGIVNSFNTEPYVKLTAVIKVDGVEVVNGFAELENSDKDFYSINIQSGNGSFNNSIKSLTLTDIATQLSGLDHEYTLNEVTSRRFSPTGIVYPNVDYGFFEKVDQGDQLFTRFYPALYMKFVIDAAILQLGYKKIGDFWDTPLYNQVAIMAKNIVSIGNIFFVEYGIAGGPSFFITRATSQISTYVIEKNTPLNFVNEINDEDSLYVTTDIGTAYTILAYNFPSTFSTGTVFEIGLNGTVNISQSIKAQYRSFNIELAQLIVRLEIWNKATDTFVGYAIQIEYDFYTASYEGGGGSVFLNSDNLISTFSINEAINNPSGLNAIGATATDHCLVWRFAVQTTQTSLVAPPSVTYDSFPDIAVDLEFSINQDLSAIIPDMKVIDSFDDINIGDAFLYLCSVGGVLHVVDEGLKTIRMIEFDTIKRNKVNALNWSDKIDLSVDPDVSFKMNYARQNLFNYNNDAKDVWLNRLTNYGQGVLTVDNQNLDQEVTKYKSPFSLCAIAPTFNNTRAMAKIYTGEKFTFTGVNPVIIEDAPIGGFTTRVVFLSPITTNLIQLTGGRVLAINYEVNNTPLLFDYVLRNRYSLINDLLVKTKVVRCLLRLDQVDFSQFDFTKPIFIDYFNDTFVVNEIDQFKVNEVDSTFVTLIRL
jgi:hypothetical protein